MIFHYIFSSFVLTGWVMMISPSAGGALDYLPNRTFDDALETESGRGWSIWLTPKLKNMTTQISFVFLKK
jgi:hypothetical protein